MSDGLESIWRQTISATSILASTAAAEFKPVLISDDESRSRKGLTTSERT